MLCVVTACSDSTAPEDKTGSLTVEMVGLPAGAAAEVTIVRGVMSRLVVESTTVTGLNEGSWTITAGNITVNGVVYAPQPASQSVNVNSRSVGSARVVWTPITGSLAVSIVGLPQGANADVEVIGTGFSRVLTSSTLVTTLPPGQYEVRARDVRLESGAMRATNVSQIIAVHPSIIAIPVTVSYGPAPAVVIVTASGLPNGVAPVITVTNPAGTLIPITDSTLLSPVSAGRWRLSASAVGHAGSSYAPTPTSRDTTVSAGDTLRLPVAYALSTGSIALAVGGLPQGATGAVTITGPGGFAQAFTGTATITGLTPGTYTVQADSVVRSGFAYRASAPSQQVTVVASLTAAPAIVTYARVSGTLVVTVSNVPNGATGSVRVTGPYGFDQTVTGNTQFSPVPAGPFTITAASLVQMGVPYEVTPSTVMRTVAVNGRDSVDMRYENVAGSLQVTINGLPGGVNGDLTLTGNSQTIAITSSTTVQNLGPGTYTLTAANVSASGTTYAPNQASQNISITKQTQSLATVTYAVVNTAIDLVLDNAFLTQATQKADGSVALVAGRDALLRVFAHADRSNGLTPTVRARIYDGATLIQTATINGPVGGVPTATNEAVMGLSWNVVIPGANIRTNTRILVDIDPTNAVTEADETNNIWPANSTPQTVSVLTVPTFTVRFVPVTVGSLTGNVTAGNMNSFLTTTRLMWPVQTIASDVRAPFTSSADTLLSNDSNNKWIVVLNEMNTLRATDNAPATMHYYGVVKVGYNSGIAGYGYVPGRAAMGWDYLPSGDGVAAHEWGHNFSRPHAPCGGVANPDPTYPYAGGIIGVTGWNSTTNTLVSSAFKDLMSYCDPDWVSDYNWTKVINYRQSSGMEATAGAVGDGLLVWGRISGGTITLEPAFRVRAPITAPSRRATHTVEALDANGAVLLSLPIEAEKVDHVTDREERHFAVVLPYNSTVEQALSQMRVRDNRTPLVAASRSSASALSANLSRDRRSPEPLIMPSADGSVVAISGGRSRIQWDTSRYPMAMVRDVATGQIMGYVRASGRSVVTNGRAIEVVYSDGVRSVTQRN
jgi:hypothetical protein